MEYKTKDLYEAAFLFNKGFDLLHIDKEGRICWFIFKDDFGTLNASDQAQKFWNKEAIVDAKSYVDAIRNLKSRIFSKQTRE